MLIYCNFNVLLGPIFFFGIVNNAAGNIPVFGRNMYSFLMGIELEVELLGSMVSICLII